MSLSPADHSSRGTLPSVVCLRIESHRGHGRLSLVSVVCCRYISPSPADHSSRGTLPSVVCLSVVVKTRL